MYSEQHPFPMDLFLARYSAGRNVDNSEAVQRAIKLYILPKWELYLQTLHIAIQDTKHKKLIYGNSHIYSISLTILRKAAGQATIYDKEDPTYDKEGNPTGRKGVRLFPIFYELLPLFTIHEKGTSFTGNTQILLDKDQRNMLNQINNNAQEEETLREHFTIKGTYKTLTLDEIASLPTKPVNIETLEQYIKVLNNDITVLQTGLFKRSTSTFDKGVLQGYSTYGNAKAALDKKQRNLRYANKIIEIVSLCKQLGVTSSDAIPFQSKQSEYGRCYHTGFNLQNAPKEVRKRALGAHTEIDINASVVGAKLLWAQRILNKAYKAKMYSYADCRKELEALIKEECYEELLEQQDALNGMLQAASEEDAVQIKEDLALIRKFISKAERKVKDFKRKAGITNDGFDASLMFPYTARYIRNKTAIRKELAELLTVSVTKTFAVDLVKQALTALSFGATLQRNGYEKATEKEMFDDERSDDIKIYYPAVKRIIKNTTDFDAFSSHEFVIGFVAEQQFLQKMIVEYVRGKGYYGPLADGEFEEHFKEKLVYNEGYENTFYNKRGQIISAKVMALVYQTTERTYMNEVKQYIDDNCHQNVMLMVHDAVLLDGRPNAARLSEIKLLARDFALMLEATTPSNQAEFITMDFSDYEPYRETILTVDYYDTQDLYDKQKEEEMTRTLSRTLQNTDVVHIDDLVETKAMRLKKEHAIQAELLCEALNASAGGLGL